MCDPTIHHPEEQACLINTIKQIMKSIESGEKKLRKLFKNDNKQN